MSGVKHPREPDIKILAEYEKRKLVDGVTYLPVLVQVRGMVPEPIARRLISAANECVDCCGPMASGADQDPV